MQKTCREAYTIYTQYNSINKTCEERVKYFDQILKTFAKKDSIHYESLIIITVYAEKSISKDNLSDEQKGRLINSIAELNIAPWAGQKVSKVIIRLMDAIMN